MGGAGFEVSVQASPVDAGSWVGLARRCEDLGFGALLVSDHLGSGPSPFVALAAAASVTSTVRLGSYVLNAGVRDPLLIASDVATLDVVSAGRAEVGLGAGQHPWAVRIGQPPNGDSVPADPGSASDDDLSGEPADDVVGILHTVGLRIGPQLLRQGD